MFKYMVLCAALLCASLSTAAQDSGAFDTSSIASESPAPASLYPSDRAPWQLGVGFQYQHFNVLGKNFHTFGYEADVTRYLSDWFGVEGLASMGFGHVGTNPQLSAKSLFLGGGPHIAFANRTRIEPWVHVLAGLDHFRFTQTTTLGARSRPGFVAGGGADFKLGGSAFWRVQADFLGSKFKTSSAMDKSYSIGTGLVFNF